MKCQSVVNVLLFGLEAGHGPAHVPENGSVNDGHDERRDEHAEPLFDVRRESENQRASIKAEISSIENSRLIKSVCVLHPKRSDLQEEISPLISWW